MRFKNHRITATIPPKSDRAAVSMLFARELFEPGDDAVQRPLRLLARDEGGKQGGCAKEGRKRAQYTQPIDLEECGDDFHDEAAVSKLPPAGGEMGQVELVKTTIPACGR